MALRNEEEHLDFRRLIVVIAFFCVAARVTAQSSVTADAHPVASPASPNVDVKTGDSTSASAFRVFNATSNELLRVRGDEVIVLGSATGSQWHPVLTPVIEHIDTSIAFGVDTDLHLVSNAYSSLSGPWRYKTSDLASDYYLNKGGFGWRVAPAGTADNALSWVDAMNLTNAGNLGIGTASPDKKLHIHDSTDNQAIHLTGTSTGTTATDGFYFSVVGTRDAQLMSLENGFMRFGTNAIERMRIDSAGSIGIGTTAPRSIL